MSHHGTDAYLGVTDLPPLVARAVTVAGERGFAHSCRPEQGRLLKALASGALTAIGETGTGCGVGLAWLASGAGPDVRLVSVERNPVLARIAADLFDDDPRVTVLRGEWREIVAHGPFDLLALDGGGQGKRPGDAPADPEELLTPQGTLLIDDFTPGFHPDPPREHWLTHPALTTVELRLAPDFATLVGTHGRR
ncbi:O-methyltransferase [Streptomyces radicis]|uniref:SAM-dependent methyltransferase n=1 Tax=Streptomyces radicis TaxID=1750517 RepID=A0A3A9W155_9ACTN|nr:class I SAM-dependent methyltransferase [Streptomyces radicis]RKN06888.1 SAM-dependent methyltransferase [Streptomyces radicis]RKN19506.1 SAM-dependent methyltransferase [Streptomyces radicis]